MIVTSKLSADLTHPSFRSKVNAVQGDGNTRQVEILLWSDGMPWVPPENLEAVITYYNAKTRAKGMYNLLADGEKAVSVSGSKATVILAPQMLADSGEVQVSLMFNDEKLNRLCTFPFEVLVAPNPAAGAQKTEDYIRLQWLEDKLEALWTPKSSAIDDAVSDAGKAAALANTAAGTALAGADAAKEAAGKADKAAMEADAARDGANAAAETANKAAAAAQDVVDTVAPDVAQLKTDVAGKADKEQADRTNRSLDYLWKKSKGIVYDSEVVTGAGSEVSVPNGAMEYAALKVLGGMSMRVDGVDHLIDAPVDKISTCREGGTVIAEKTIPQSIIDLCPDYGIGVNADCHNYIDFAERKYHKRVGKVDMGSLAWTIISGENRFRCTWRGYKKPSDGHTPANILCAKYENIGAYHVNGTDQTIGAHPTLDMLCANDLSFNGDAAAFKAAMSGVMLYYELEEEQIIDLSDVIPEDFEILQVEAGGSIRMHYPALDEGYEVAVPSETEILVNVAEVNA